MTDFTELAQRLATCAKEGSYPVLSPVECGALVEALEKAQRVNNSAPTILRQLAEEKQKRGGGGGSYSL
ncbi:TPA: hypothetical protein I8542_004056 [Raoultella ornithinolytica]|nr:hypothetical protein [Raoultella ornithinolytica]